MWWASLGSQVGVQVLLSTPNHAQCRLYCAWTQRHQYHSLQTVRRVSGTCQVKYDLHIGHEAALVADQRKVMNECSIVVSVSIVLNIQPFLFHFPGKWETCTTSRLCWASIFCTKRGRYLMRDWMRRWFCLLSSIVSSKSLLWQNDQIIIISSDFYHSLHPIASTFHKMAEWA